jgi:hypothetical protein
MQIEEILDNGATEICIKKHSDEEGIYVVQAVDVNGEVFDQDAGPDIGELVNELHERL